MGDKDQCRSAAIRRLEQQVRNSVAGGLVEIPGRFVGKDQARRRCDGAGDGDALLLSSGKLAWIVLKARLKAHRGELLVRCTPWIDMPREVQGRCHILDRGHGRDEVEGLEDKSDMVTAKAREFVLVQCREIATEDLDPAGGRMLEACKKHEEGRLAGARRTDQGDSFACLDTQAQGPEHVDTALLALEGERDIVELYGDAVHVFLSLCVRAPR